MTQSNIRQLAKPMPSGKPVKPKKPLPAKGEPAKIPVHCSTLTEIRVRKIAREEILNREIEKIRDISKVDFLAKKRLETKRQSRNL